MKEFRVIIPEERYQIVKFRQDSLPGVMVLNRSLNKFEPKEVFEWHLSIMIMLQDLIENGMPSASEREILDPYGDYLDAVVKGDDLDKPNALFLARITWNKTRELIYRIHDPKPTAGFLEAHITEKAYPRKFDYRVDHDPEWKLTAWHLDTLNSQQDEGGNSE